MPHDFDWYTKRKDAMLEEDFERDKKYDNYLAMYHSEWDLPAELEAVDWVRKVVSTDPYDAVAAGVRVLATTEPEVKFQPLNRHLETKQRANEWERNLLWQLAASDRRRKATVVSDMVRSALIFDEISVQVVDLDYQIEQLDMFDAKSKRLEAARRYGRFMIQTYNPKHVHARYSGLMPECVVLTTKKMGSSIISEFGSLAKELEGMEDDWFLFCDFMDYEDRCVWVEPLEGGGGEVKIIEPTSHDMPFLNWVTMVGATSMEDKPEHQRQPLLYSVENSGNWETHNVVKTLYISEVIAHAASARSKEEGPNPEEAVTETMDPSRKVKVPVGNTYEQLRPPEIDQALLLVDDKIASSIDKSTVSRILMNADVPQGAAFASLNLATQTAVGALKPAKMLAERALAETFTVMLLWSDFTDIPITGFGKDPRSDYGMQYVIEPELIDPNAIYISVELKPDVPTDRQQRVNTAALAVQSLNYPREYALEDIGVADPQAAEEQRALEILQDAQLQMLIQQQQAEMSQAIQTQAQIQQMVMQSVLQQAQQPPGGMPGQPPGMPPGGQMGGPPPGPPPGMGAGPPQPGGDGFGPSPLEQGFNPALQGQPPAEANPYGLTREAITGRTRRGEEIEEGF